MRGDSSFERPDSLEPKSEPHADAAISGSVGSARLVDPLGMPPCRLGEFNNAWPSLAAEGARLVPRLGEEEEQLRCRGAPNELSARAGSSCCSHHWSNNLPNCLP